MNIESRKKTLVVSANARDTEAAFETYRELYSVGSAVEPRSGRFHAEVVAQRRTQMLVFERRLSNVSHRRDAKRIARDAFDHVTFHIVRSGWCAVEVGEKRQVVRPGEIVFFDNRFPQRTFTDDLHLVSISLKRDMVAPRILRGHFSHGLVLDRAKGGESFDDIHALVAACLTRDVANGAEEIGRTIGDLLDGDGTRGSRSELQAYARLRRFLTQRGSHLDVNADDLARGSGLSRSALYRMLEPNGGAAEFLQQWRLRRFKGLLMTEPEWRTIGQLAEVAGFASPTHATRRFHRAFDVAPGAFRRSRRHALTQAPESLRFDPWLQELY